MWSKITYAKSNMTLIQEARYKIPTESFFEETYVYTEIILLKIEFSISLPLAPSYNLRKYSFTLSPEKSI